MLRPSQQYSLLEGNDEPVSLSTHTVAVKQYLVNILSTRICGRVGAIAEIENYVAGRGIHFVICTMFSF